MSVLNIQVIDQNVTSNGETLTLGTPVSSLSNAFIRNTNVRKVSAGPIGNTGNIGPDGCSTAAHLTATDTVTFYKNNATQQKYIAEIWEHTGASGNPDEFIVRGRFSLTPNPTATTPVSGIVDRNKCVAFITGKLLDSSDRNEWDHSGTIAYVDELNNLVVERGGSAYSQTIYVTVVEFTGSNWIVGYSRYGFGGGSKTIYEDSRGNTGNAINIPSWSSAIILEVQHLTDGSNEALEDMSLRVSPGGSDTLVTDIENTAANNSDGFSYILYNPNLITTRTILSKNIPNNNTYDTLTTSSSGATDSSARAVEFTAYSDGSGTAHARGCLSAYVTSDTTIDTWVHRSGNAGYYGYGIVDLKNVAGVISPIISSGPAIWPSGGVSSSQIFGTNFGTNTGSAEVIISDNISLGAGNENSCSIVSWSDTQVTFVPNLTGYTFDVDTPLYIFLVDSVGTSATAWPVSYSPVNYEQNILDFSPDHYIKFESNYTATVGTIDAETRTGSPVFTGPSLNSASSGSIFLPAGSGARMNDSNFMNLNNETTRYLQMWIRLQEIPESPVCIYEEGGGVNNLAFFVAQGGTLIAQFADTGDDNVHVYSNVSLSANRTYCIAFAFDYNSTSEFVLYVDGVKQDVSFGNPLISTDLDAHSGDISFGTPEGSLEVFGTDVTFLCPNFYMSDFISSRTFPTENTVENDLFLPGVIGEVTISSDTEANMQTALTAYANSVRPNALAAFYIEDCLDGDFQLNFDNIVFHPNTRFEVFYAGGSNLTLINANGSNLNPSKVRSLFGATVNVVTPATVTVTGAVSGSEIRIYEAGTTNEIAGIESSVGDFSASVEASAVDIAVISTNYKIIKIKDLDILGDTTVPISQQLDRQYENP